MHLDLAERTARMSVRELAEFSPLPALSDGRFAAWRAAVGRHWHASLRLAAAAAAPQSQFECQVAGPLRRGGWTFALSGRIDQLVPDGDGWELREIKSVQRRLPEAWDVLRAELPSHFHQAALYHLLAVADPRWQQQKIGTALVLVAIDDGITQRLPLGAADLQALEDHLAVCVAWLEGRRQAAQYLRALTVRPPFASWRDGQVEARAALADAIASAPLVFFQAPTGFGKTGLILEAALRRLQDGLIDRIVYLTGKHTGRDPVLGQLPAMTGGANAVRHLVVHSRAQHGSGRHWTWQDRIDFPRRWLAAGMDMPTLLRAGTVTLERIRELGAQLAIDPFAITRWILPWVEIWIGDYNHVFHPGVEALFLGTPGFDPAHTLLVVDEAHNLPARALDNWTHRLVGARLEALIGALHNGRFPGRLAPLLDRWLHELLRLPVCAELDDAAAARMFEYAGDCLATIEDSQIDLEHLDDDLRDALWELTAFCQGVLGGEVERHNHIPEPGVLLSACLSAAPVLAPRLRAYGRCLLASATLDPVAVLRGELGLRADEGAVVGAGAPWQDGAYRVAVDLRVDTRLRARMRHLPTTAATVRRLVEACGPPVAVFFPSFRYAEAVAAEPDLWRATRVALQPRSFADSADEAAFIESALATCDALFLVLGSRYSEGIDSLGGRVAAAMVVGPALPEINPVQEARRRALGGARADGFRIAYQVPGMRRINQALGRLVRAPGHRASILLHCERFAEPEYQSLLNPLCRGGSVITTDGELDDWLAEPGGQG
jgi:Rad3-related DNA helicase